MAAILEMPQYVEHLENISYGFIKLSAKRHLFNISCTIGVLIAVPTTMAPLGIRGTTTDKKQSEMFPV